MLSLKDYKYKTVVFIFTNSDHLKFKNENLVLQEKETNKIKNQIPCIRISCIFIIGNITITNHLIEKASQYGFVIAFLKQNFRPYGILGAQTEGNTLLRSKQYQFQHNHELAIYLVKNKILNQLSLLKNIRKKNDSIRDSIQKIDKQIDLLDILHIKDNNTLLGIEGNCSRWFFKAFFYKNEWKGRKPRTKMDPINTIMDIGYTFLFHFIESNLRLYGFDVYQGVYHRLFYQRKSLVCDLVEPFRCIIDQIILKAFNLGQFQTKDFIISKNQFQLRITKNKEYTRILFENLIKHKEPIFIYIQNYYRAFIRNKNIHEYPQFFLKKEV